MSDNEVNKINTSCETAQVQPSEENMTDEQSYQYHKERYIEKLRSKIAKKASSCIKYKEEYEKWVEDIKWANGLIKKDFSSNKAEKSRQISRLHNLKKKYAILDVGDIERVIKAADADKPNHPIYLYLEEMYDKTLEEHRAALDPGRDSSHKVSSLRYNNITIESISLFKDFC